MGPLVHQVPGVQDAAARPDVRVHRWAPHQIARVKVDHGRRRTHHGHCCMSATPSRIRRLTYPAAICQLCEIAREDPRDEDAMRVLMRVRCTLLGVGDFLHVTRYAHNTRGLYR